MKKSIESCHTSSRSREHRLVFSPHPCRLCYLQTPSYSLLITSQAGHYEQDPETTIRDGVSTKTPYFPRTGYYQRRWTPVFPSAGEPEGILRTSHILPSTTKLCRQKKIFTIDYGYLARLSWSQHSVLVKNSMPTRRGPSVAPSCRHSFFEITRRQSSW